MNRIGIAILLSVASVAGLGAGAGRAGPTGTASVLVSGSTIVYTAGPGEQNNVFISDNGISGGLKRFAISDVGATIVPANSGCSGGGGGAAVCSVPQSSVPGYNIDLGDQNDRLDVRSTLLMGASTIKGGAGQDTIADGPGPDVIDGGDDFDTVTYASRPGPVSASIGCQSGFLCGADGVQNENDDIQFSVEHVIGGPGGDAMAAGLPTSVQHDLTGGPGNDTLLGNVGKNTLDGGPGQDSLTGFDGNDAIASNDGEPDTVSCGGGDRDTASIDLKDTLQDGSCENVAVAAVDQGPNVRIGHVRLDNGTLSIELACPKSPEGRCAGTLAVREIIRTTGRNATPKVKGTLRVVTRTIARSHYRIATARSLIMRLPHLFRIHGKLQIASVEQDANGKPKTTVATRELGRSAQSAGAAKPNVLLVHGAFADGSGWSEVVERLQADGFNVVVSQIPLTSPADDVAAVQRDLRVLGGPTILVGHSYGGFVITQAAAAAPNVVGLVYIAAIAPDTGETAAAFNTLAPPLPSAQDFVPIDLPHVGQNGAPYVIIARDRFRDDYCQDCGAKEGRVLAASEVPVNASAFGVPLAGAPAWKTIPSWYEISTDDRIINPAAQRIMAARLDSTGDRTTEVDSGHAAPITHAKEVSRLIERAAK